ncbi:hypothetical protein [Sinorhizobium americanum]|uniref:hypothetical protein n=1 Tax=Sinorhizobium americanum TaxID=194963 RepID=UPI0007D8DC9F|nr:hypothetical protein [Sinorhizobium americanum]OAP43192.1 hypothetical protein ATC00_04640 [Sinorhizobium americanum]
MIPELIEYLWGSASEISTTVSCLLREYEKQTQWRMFPDSVNALDVITALGAFGSFLAVIGAAVAIFQSAKARNLATVIELTRQLSSEREKAHVAGIYGWKSEEFHAYQMVHLVEQASMIVNQGWVSGKSKEFLLDWLRGEIPSMAEQPAYQATFNDATGQELCELFKLRDKFVAERRRAELFERIYEQRRSRKGIADTK